MNSSVQQSRRSWHASRLPDGSLRRQRGGSFWLCVRSSSDLAASCWTAKALPILTLGARLNQSACVKITGKGQVTIPSAMRKKHGLLPQREVEFVDQPDGVLVVKASKLSRGKRVLAALLRGGKVKGNTESWLRLTRGAA